MTTIRQTQLGLELRRMKLACGAEALAMLIRRIAAALADYRQMRRERAQLLALSDRDLRDIGITRVDALRAATKPRSRQRSAIGRSESG
jgi:uncharacterized protein YjiS (DUF1127 family)